MDKNLIVGAELEEFAIVERAKSGEISVENISTFTWSTNMPFNDIEKKRIERAIAAFMSSHRPPIQVRSQVDLGSNIKGYSIEIFEIRPQWDNRKVIQHHPCAKATYLKSRDLWKLYWMKADLKWHAYAPASQVKKIEEVLEIVGNDENCCFFG